MNSRVFLPLLLIVLSLSCRRDIPEPPLAAQSMGVPLGSGNSAISFYSSSSTRYYTITVDGVWQATVSGSAQSLVCRGQGTATFNLDDGMHSYSFTWTDNTQGTTGSGSGSFTLNPGDCILYPL
jgi:hypothetical protein